MLICLGLFFLFLSFYSAFSEYVASPNYPTSLWKEGGVVVNDSIGNTLQQHPKLVRSGASNNILVFEDFRDGNADLYIQKINDEGSRLWGKSAFPLAKFKNEQIFPQIAADGIGGAFIVWQDNRSKDFDIYLQRVDANGALLFPKNGIPVCTEKGGQVFPQLVADGKGGVIVTWFDYRSGEEDIYAQRITSKGELLWSINGVPVCKEKATQWYPKLVDDGEGGAFFVWADRRSGDFDIYAQQLDAKGTLLWPASGIAVCRAEGNQDKPQIVRNDNDRIFIAWSDGRPREPGVFVQSLDYNGKNFFAQNGIRVANNFVKETTPCIIKDTKGGCLVVWSDSHAGDSDVYMQKVSQNGEMLWGEASRPVISKSGLQENPIIFGDSPFYVAWEESSGKAQKIYLQKITEDGYLIFDKEGILLSEGEHSAQQMDVSVDKDGDVNFCFQDNKEGNFDIYAQKISKGGGYSWGKEGRVINNVSGSVIQQNFKVIGEEDDSFYFVFEDKRSGFFNVYAQKLNLQGFLLWDTNGVCVEKEFFDQKNPDVALDGRGGAYVVWEDYRNYSNPKIYLQHFNQEGESFLQSGVVLTPKLAFAKQRQPKIIYDGNGGAVIVFVNEGEGGTAIYAQRVNSKGELLWGDEGKILSKFAGRLEEPLIDSKSLISVWTDYRKGDRNSDIYAQKVDLSGKTLLANNGAAICEAPDLQSDVVLVNDAGLGVIVGWTDKGSGNFDIYAQKVGVEGNPLWIKDGVPVCQVGRTQQRPKIISLSGGSSFFVWEDFRFGNWDIFGQELDSQGRVQQFGETGKDGVAICTVPGTQYSPEIINLGKNKLIAWEDYRDGKVYSIYLQALDNKNSTIFDKNGILIKETRAGARLPQLVSVGSRAFLLAWEDYNNGGRSIMAQKFRF